MEDGYEFFARRQLVTLFSAPNYCGEFDNAGGMMSIDETLMCSFQVIVVTVPIAVVGLRFVLSRVASHDCICVVFLPQPLHCDLTPRHRFDILE